MAWTFHFSRAHRINVFFDRAVPGGNPQTGIYNFCNPGAISHNQVLELYRDLTNFQTDFGVSDGLLCVFFLVGWDTEKNLFSGKWGQRVSKMQKPSFLWYDSCFCGNILVVWCFHFSCDFSIAGSREGLYWPRLQVGQLHHRRTGQGDHRSTLQQWAEPTQDVEGLALRFALSMWLKDVKVGEWFNDVSARALQMPNGPHQFFFSWDDARLLHLW